MSSNHPDAVRHARRSAGRRRGTAVLLTGAAGVVAAAVVAGSLAAPTADAASPVLTVAADGSGQYRTVQAAVDALPADGAAHTILVARGVYPEVLDVPKTATHLTLQGATGNPEDVVITAAHAAGTAKPGGGTYGTMGSATATFRPTDLLVTGLTIRNTFDPAADPTIVNTQAVALAALGDRQVYLNDRIIGRQDTLLAWSPDAKAQTRQYFRDDFVAGTVDFLFGNATAVFDRVNLQAIDRGANAGGTNGVLTAANTDSAKQYGFLITNSTVYSSGADSTVWLGRPWHPTATAVAQVVVRDTVLPAAIKSAAPWTDMSGFSWTAARFAEYHNSGPGAGAGASRPQLTDAQAAGYTAQKYLAGTDGWDPTGTAVPAAPGTTTTATTTTVAPAVKPYGTITGDTRTVTEPVVPSPCATVAAGLTLTNRVGTAAQEAAPPDTARIQNAIDGCAQTGAGSVAVKLVASGGHADLLSGPLKLKRGVVLVLDAGVTLYAARAAALYQVTGGPTCGTVVASGAGAGCVAFVTAGAANAGIEGVRDAAGHEGRIDGRGDLTVLGTSTTWWGLAAQAKTSGGKQQNPRLVQASAADNFTLYHVDLVNAPAFHVVFANATGFTVWGIRIKTPASARNTDGIDPSGATDVTIRDSFISAGDDGVAIKAGSRASRNITIYRNHFYGTHGLSIGSETAAGVSNVLARSNWLDGTDPWGTASGASTGLRIKSSPAAGGAVTDVAYTDTCVRATKAPLVFDTHYMGQTGSLTPQFTRITVARFSATASPKGATSTFVGIDAGHRLGLRLNQVQLDVPTSTAAYAAFTSSGTNLAPSGTGVTVTAGMLSGAVPACTFAPFPAL